MRPLSNANAATAGRRDGSGDVFLRKARLAKELEGAEGEKEITPVERGALVKIRELANAVDEAVRAGRDSIASRLLSEAMTALAAWHRNLATRRARDRASAEWMAAAETENQPILRTIMKFILFGGLGVLFLCWLLSDAIHNSFF